MKVINKAFFAIVFVITGIVFPITAQQVTVAPFSLAPSTILNQLKKIRAANPDIPSKEFAAKANSLLQTEGLNFVIAFDAATCQKIELARKNLKNPNDPLNLRAALRSVDGEPANLRLPEASFDKAECGSCFISLPLLEVTAKDFVVKMMGRNIKFHLPQNFVINEAGLISGEGDSAALTRWKIPFRTTPLTVSEDGNVLYLGFSEPELKDLTLIVFGEGSFQFAERKDADLERKGQPLKDAPTDPNVSFLKFDNTRAKHIIRFPLSCANQTLK